jgi:hypothetical protein
MVPTLRQIIPTTIFHLIWKMLFNIIFRNHVLSFTFYSENPVLLSLPHLIRGFATTVIFVIKVQKFHIL